MPNCGSQVTLCNIPIRFDTYKGCSHACAYCFANRKRDISNVATAESATVLRSFIEGKRNRETNWCDWQIPLHWGGMSDPFQPAELKYRRSLECLRVFAETGYPFVISTKNALIADGEYLELIKQCNCVVQFSALCSRYDAWEKGASTFAERMKAAEIISKYKRVVVRCQPYVLEVHNDVVNNIRTTFKNAGVHGCIFESMKAQRGFTGMIRLGNDFVYPVETLKGRFAELRNEVHNAGMKFYCGENRLRYMSDELCCCGIEGMGWRDNTANLNTYVVGKKPIQYTEQMKRIGTADCFVSKQGQTTIAHHVLDTLSFADMMNKSCRTTGIVKELLPVDK